MPAAREKKRNKSPKEKGYRDADEGWERRGNGAIGLSESNPLSVGFHPSVHSTDGVFRLSGEKWRRAEIVAGAQTGPEGGGRPAGGQD